MLAEKTAQLGQGGHFVFQRPAVCSDIWPARPADVETRGAGTLIFGVGQPNGLEVLQGDQKSSGAELPVIILTGKGSVDLAVEAVQAGAADLYREGPVRRGQARNGRMEKVERMLGGIARKCPASRPRMKP